jgi:pimeloyl-ACP methyl ester carboxylesterase
MEKLTSSDGTPIAYTVAGDGPAIVFVTGAFNDHRTCLDLAAQLAGEYRTVLYDRRARGESGDTRPYAIAREVEDLAAVLEVAGGAATVFGFSSGGVLALRAATELPGITRLALYEVPFVPGRAGSDLPARLEALVDAGRPGDAVVLFQTEGIGLPAEVVEGIRRSPMFAALEAIARSTVHDATITTELSTPTAAMSAVPVPTLVLNGESTWPALTESARTLAAILPRVRHVTVAGGANHGIPAVETARILREFIAGE